MTKNILIYDNGQPFDLNTLNESPLGGSETSILLLAKGLSQINTDNKCVLLTSKQIEKQNDGNLLIDNSNFFDGYAKNADVIILNRHIPKTIASFSDKNIYYYAHDAYDQPLIQWMSVKSNLYFFKYIFCVSEWQKNKFIQYFNVPKDKLIVVGNSIDYSMTYGFSQRNNKKIIFAGIPYKGIEIIGNIFSDICKQNKFNDLEMHLYSGMSIYGQNEQDSDYELYYNSLNKMNNVFLHDPISLKELIYELKTSSIYLSPNMYHETFGINLVLAQACGCLPIATNKGAVKEVIKNNKTGFIIDYPNIEHFETYKQFLEMLKFVLSMNDQEIYKFRLNAIENAKKYDYLNIAYNFNTFINE